MAPCLLSTSELINNRTYLFEMPDDSLVGIVLDTCHPRYGQLCKILHHDWHEFGGLWVLFADGGHDEFYDGIIEGDKQSPLGRFYRHHDVKGKECDNSGRGPEGASHTYQRLNTCDEAAFVKAMATLYGDDAHI